MKQGESITFSYTGNVQSWTVETNGIYKLEVWGGKGGNGAGAGANGGYSVGYKKLAKGTVLYIVCGGAGGTGVYGGGNAGAGYNGGGNGGGSNRAEYGGPKPGGAGGGATHIALVTGTLPNIGKTSFDTNGLIVAGGGGGGASGTAGTGGGTSGGQGSARGVATQTGGYSFGQGESGTWFNWCGSGGGGGGYYGGYKSNAVGGGNNDVGYSGGGGSGWIDGVDDCGSNKKSTTNGESTGNGKAVITLFKSAYAIKKGTDDISGLYVGNIEISSLHQGSTEL